MAFPIKVCGEEFELKLIDLASPTVARTAALPKRLPPPVSAGWTATSAPDWFVGKPGVGQKRASGKLAAKDLLKGALRQIANAN
jgi:hypothetical protein